MSSTRTVSIVFTNGQTREIEFTGMSAYEGFAVFDSPSAEIHVGLGTVQTMEISKVIKGKINLITN